MYLDYFVPKHPGVQAFHKEHAELMHQAKGSASKHQAWAGGYFFHIMDCIEIADQTYPILYRIQSLPFTLDSAKLVLYFHDIEKIWKYSVGLPEGFDRNEWYDRILPERYGVTFTPDERNALTYVHGEGDDYGPERVMGPLAAFCHSIDVLSARVFYDKR